MLSGENISHLEALFQTIPEYRNHLLLQQQSKTANRYKSRYREGSLKEMMLAHPSSLPIMTTVYRLPYYGLTLLILVHLYTRFTRDRCYIPYLKLRHAGYNNTDIDWGALRSFQSSQKNYPLRFLSQTIGFLSTTSKVNNFT